MRVPSIILVTGAGGQLGRELRDIAPGFTKYKFVFKDRNELTIEQPGAIARVLEEIAPKWCINAAAYTAVDKAEDPSERDTVYAVNADAVHELASCCDKFGTRLIHVSTDYVFDGSKKAPYTEEDEVNPLGIYGDSKLKGEQYALTYKDAAVVRTSWVYSSYGRNFLKTMIRLMSERKEIKVVNDQMGSPTYAADLAGAIMKMIESKPWQPGLYHFTNLGVTSWFEFAGLIRDLINSDCQVLPIPTEQYPTPAKRPAWSVLDNSKFNRVFGHYGRDWREAVSECVGRVVNSEQ